MIQVIRGGSHTSIWIWKLLITLDYYNLKQHRVQRLPNINFAWNPS